MKGVLFIVSVLGCLSLVPSGWAATSVEVNFTGNLIIAPPCKVLDDSGSEQINVDFKDVVIQRIDGTNYREDFNIKLVCDGIPSGGLALNLTYVATPTQFDTEALQAAQADVNKKDLGIRLYFKDGGKVVSPNSKHGITVLGGTGTSLAFYAIPVKKPQGDLIAGRFEATATFSLDYP